MLLRDGADHPALQLHRRRAVWAHRPARGLQLKREVSMPDSPLAIRSPAADRLRRRPRRGAALWSALGQFLRVMLRYPTGAIGVVVLVLFTAIAVTGAAIAPYGPFEGTFAANGGVARPSPPTWPNLPGRTTQGMAGFSRIHWGPPAASPPARLSP